MIRRSTVLLWTTVIAVIAFAAYTRAPASPQGAAPQPQYVAQDDACAADPVDDADADENDLFSTTLELVCA